MQAIFHKTSTIDFTTLSLQFHLFMLAHSSYSALRLNQKLNQHLICKYTPIRINQEKLDKLIEGRDTRLFVQFIVQPHETAKIVLYHYLAKSGIVITAAMKNHARLRYIR